MKKIKKIEKKIQASFWMQILLYLIVGLFCLLLPLLSPAKSMFHYMQFVISRPYSGDYEFYFPTVILWISALLYFFCAYQSFYLIKKNDSFKESNSFAPAQVFAVLLHILYFFVVIVTNG